MDLELVSSLPLGTHCARSLLLGLVDLLDDDLARIVLYSLCGQNS